MSFGYERQIITIIDNAKREILNRPLNLGGVPGSGGGRGGPPGGFTGYLPQSRVAYDTDEYATITGSGNLVDNLNHIRYRITVLESGGAQGVITVYNNGNPVASGITVLDFINASVVETSPGYVTITVTASGTPPIYGESIDAQQGVSHYTTTSSFVPGTLRVYLNGLRQDKLEYTEDTSNDGFTINFAVLDDDIINIDYDTSTNTGGGGSSGNAYIEVLSNGTVIDSEVESINFIGSTVTQTSTGHVTVSGSSGSGDTSYATHWTPDAEPTTPHTKDDEFDDSSINAKWTEFDPGSAVTISEEVYGLKLLPTSNDKAGGLYQAAPSVNDFSITTKVWYPTGILDLGIKFKAGLLMGSNPATGGFFTFNVCVLEGSIYIQSEVYSDYQTITSTEYNTNMSDPLHAFYLRMRKTNAAGTHLDYSLDGLVWYCIYQGVTEVTPDYIGLFVNKYQAGSLQVPVMFDFFRVTESSAVDQVLYGNRVKLYK